MQHSDSEDVPRAHYDGLITQADLQENEVGEYPLYIEEIAPLDKGALMVITTVVDVGTLLDWYQSVPGSNGQMFEILQAELLDQLGNFDFGGDASPGDKVTAMVINDDKGTSEPSYYGTVVSNDGDIMRLSVDTVEGTLVHVLPHDDYAFRYSQEEEVNETS